MKKYDFILLRRDSCGRGKLSVKTSPADPLEVFMQEPVLQFAAGNVLMQVCTRTYGVISYVHMFFATDLREINTDKLLSVDSNINSRVFVVCVLDTLHTNIEVSCVFNGIS